MEPAPHTTSPPSANEAVQWELPAETHQRSPSPLSDIDEETISSVRDADDISIDSTESLPDILGRRQLTLDNEDDVTAYEAWEISAMEDKYYRESWLSFFGIRFGSKWVNRNDGSVVVSAAATFEQGELADLYGDAIRTHKHRRCTSQEMAYEQDLANRAGELPRHVYDRIQLMLEAKTAVTNRSPYRKREWRLVVLQPGEFRMTALQPERRRKHPFPWKKKSYNRTWVIIFRGQEVKSTKEDGGWRSHNRASNPWWRLDSGETKEERNKHRDVTLKMDIARNTRRQHHRHRPRPVGPTPPDVKPPTNQPPM